MLIQEKTGKTLSELALAPVGPLHYYTGIGGLAGMAFHFLVALAATISGKADQANHAFHRVSLFIYTLWMLAFLTGAVIGIIAAVSGSYAFWVHQIIPLYPRSNPSPARISPATVSKTG